MVLIKLYIDTLVYFPDSKIFHENQKGILRYISFKFLCFSLYIIGFYYAFLNNSLENSSLEIAKNCNLYKRNLGEAQTKNKGPKWKRYLKYKKEDLSKTKYNTNNIKSNEQSVQENKYCTNNEIKNNNVENKSNISISNINYNDLSKNLTEKELCDVLNSLKECPPKEDLRNIWNHTVGVAKEGLDDIQKELKASIQKYLDNDIYVQNERNNSKTYVYGNIWDQNISIFYKTLGTEEILYAKNFFSLINGKHTLDDILKFLYSFIEHFKTLKKQLHQYHQKEILKDMELEHNRTKSKI
ncbi:Plasmodium exported protein (PHISTa), unknown function [Plasmodium sp. gorilla clade G2]|uniref:Plasmodium exported protein (PHISTa), unknown function n=1 Tax=Plasmodium sp. gorilla clade G2 TaxID=880535 RepID=UPI000D2D1AA1|nr:Plasmodium exported protein (PHISTa), unknown function [Plasmodium sp. gorilla clade G2]SOV20439.1 Plasmodium exported protein (PHISTa), unknown function [Plasmodium sp. gorilla clade G2]